MAIKKTQSNELLNSKNVEISKFNNENDEILKSFAKFKKQM